MNSGRRLRCRRRLLHLFVHIQMPYELLWSRHKHSIWEMFRFCQSEHLLNERTETYLILETIDMWNYIYTFSHHLVNRCE